MFKKLLIASAVLVASSSVLAANYKGEYKDYKDAPAPCPTYTFAAGPYVGVSVGPRVVGTGSPTYSASFNGTLFAGYAAMVSPVFYLAGELFGQGDWNIKDFKNGDAGAKTGWGWGANIRPGYMITDHVLGYVLGGYVQTRFTDQDVTKSGWQLGLGGETNIYQNWDLRGEYVYSQYGSVSGIGKALSNQFNLGLVYKFV